MQVRALGTTGVSTVRNKLALFYGKLSWLRAKVNRPGFFGVLGIPDILVKCRIKRVDMSVHGGKTVGVCYIYTLTKSKGCYRYPGNIAICCGMHGKVFALLGAYIESHMPVIAPQLAKIGGKGDGNIHRVAEIAFLYGGLG